MGPHNRSSGWCRGQCSHRVAAVGHVLRPTAGVAKCADHIAQRQEAFVDVDACSISIVPGRKSVAGTTITYLLEAATQWHWCASAAQSPAFECVVRGMAGTVQESLPRRQRIKFTAGLDANSEINPGPQKVRKQCANREINKVELCSRRHKVSADGGKRRCVRRVGAAISGSVIRQQACVSNKVGVDIEDRVSLCVCSSGVSWSRCAPTLPRAAAHACA